MVGGLPVPMTLRHGSTRARAAARPVTRWTVGTAGTSCCIRMRNVDVIDLYRQVPIGAPVIVLR